MLTVWVCLHGPSDDEKNRSKPNRLFWPFRLHRPVTEKTTVSKLMLLTFHVLCHFVTKHLCTHDRQYIALLFYIIPWSEQKWVAGNNIKNRKLYCLVRVCRCFVIILNLYIFQCRYEYWGRGGKCMAGGYFADVVLHSSRIYHQEHGTESRRLPNNIAVAWGAVICLFHGVANQY